VIVVDQRQETRLRALYDAHAPALLAYALRLTDGDRGRAEDVVQETLLRAWQHPEASEPTRGEIRPWLFTVARHLAVDAHRARGARPSEVDDRGLASVVASSGSDDIDAALDRVVVSDALAALSEQHRAVLVEMFFHDRGVAETAAALDIPMGTVKSRTYYALRALKLALSERGVAT
jgi:RNA polymerase sigma-70 factor (ECF subfamily)